MRLAGRLGRSGSSASFGSALGVRSCSSGLVGCDQSVAVIVLVRLFIWMRPECRRVHGTASSGCNLGSLG